jgi:hypothetical protein
MPFVVGSLLYGFASMRTFMAFMRKSRKRNGETETENEGKNEGLSKAKHG